MSGPHYTDEEKIKRLLAEHESDKQDLATQAARIASLEAALAWYADEWNYFSDEECQEICTPYLGKGKLGSLARALLKGGKP